MLLAIGLIIRLSQGPIDLAFAKDKIEQSLSSKEKGYNLSINHLKLKWPNLKEPLMLDLGRVQIRQDEKQGQNQSADFSFDTASLGLLGTDLFNGQILNFSLQVNNPTIQLIEKDGKLNFFWQKNQVETVESETEVEEVYGPQLPKKTFNDQTEDLRKNAIKILEELADPYNKDTKLLSFLKEIRVRNISIVGAHSGVEKSTDYLGLADLTLIRSKNEINGDLSLDLPGANNETAKLKADILYRRIQKDLTFTSYIKDVNPANFIKFFPNLKILEGQDLQVSGQLLTAFDGDLNLKDAALKINMPEANINIKDEYPKPINIKNFKLTANLNKKEQKLNISDMSASVWDVPIEIESNARVTSEMIQAPLVVKIDTISLDNVARLVPKSHRNSALGQWLTAKIIKGKLNNLLVTTNVHLHENPEENTQKIKVAGTKATFDVAGSTVKYSSTLMPVTDIVAQASYENDILKIDGQSGSIGDIKGRNIKVVLRELTAAGRGDADIKIDAKGPTKTLFKYLYDKPISLKEDLGFDEKQIKGITDANIHIKFPLTKDLPKEKVIVDVKGTMTDLFLPNVVKGMPLSGGPYKISYKDGLIDLKGSGQINGKNIDLTLKEYISSGKQEYDTEVSGKLISDKALREKLGINLEEYISGNLPIEFVYQSKNRVANLEVKGDVSPLEISIPSLRYRKPVNTAGDLSLTAKLTNNNLTEINNLNLSTQGLKIFKGRLLFKGNSELSRGNIANLDLNNSKANVDFEITSNDILKLVLKGSVFDLVPFMEASTTPVISTAETPASTTSSSTQIKYISVIADKLLMKNNKAFTNATVYLELDKQSDITRLEMDANAGGKPMYVRFKPEEGTGYRTFSLQAEDAGKTLDVLGIYSNIRGGKLNINGRPLKGSKIGDLYGAADITNFRIVDAPVLANLLNATSMKGAQELLGKEGVSFTKLESQFEWRFSPKGNILVVKKGRTSGASLGLTFEGIYDQEKSNIDMSGTIIPLSGVNTAISGVPILGNLLGGKDGALFAATYKLKGVTKDPKISINPLSVLAPGFLRNILFKEDVKDKVKDKIEEKSKE